MTTGNHTSFDDVNCIVDVHGVVWALAPHAAIRVREMDVGMSAVEAAINRPETDYPSIALAHPPGRRCRTRGDLVLVYDSMTCTVITVLWNRRDGRAA